MNSKLTKKYYVYKVTNSKNGKIYIGKRAHHTPEEDNYMGSGKLIIAAIKKHGIGCFIKEILAVFESEVDAAKLEANLVTKEFIKESNTYNMHEGGYGGFSHINSDPNSKEWKSKGGKNAGGTKNWTEESWRKVREYSWTNSKVWESLSEEEYSSRCRNISEAVRGVNNSQYGTHVYVNPDLTILPSSSELNRHRYRPGQHPEGWITVSEWKDLRKDKTKASYGKHWYNDGVNNYLYFSENPLIIDLKLVVGRLNPTAKKNCCDPILVGENPDTLKA